MSRTSQPSNADLSHPNDLPRPAMRAELVGKLREQLARRGVRSLVEKPAGFSSGAADLDRLLPGGGLWHGMLIEWLGARNGSGTASLGLLGAREACREGGVLVVIDRTQTFYPPEAGAWGIELDRLIVVHPQNARDELWAAVQALRSPVVAAMWANIARLDGRAFRRLQLAAEAGRTLGVLVRPITARGQPSWADVRVEVSPLSVVPRSLHFGNGPRTTDHGRLVHIRITHCRNGRSGGSAILEIDDVSRTVQTKQTYPPSATDQTFSLTADSQHPTAFHHDAHALPVVTELADPTSHSFSARA